MAKDKDDVTPEVTTPATTRPGFSTQVTDAPNYNPDTASVSRRVQEEMDAGRASLRDMGAAAAASGYIDPADADHWRAGAVAKVINDAKQVRDLEEANPLPGGEISPGEVPSKGYTYVPPASEANEADKEQMERVARVAEAQEARIKLARETEEAQVKDTVARANRGSGGNDIPDFKDRADKDKAERDKETAKEIDEVRDQLAKNRELHGGQQTKPKK